MEDPTLRDEIQQLRAILMDHIEQEAKDRKVLLGKLDELYNLWVGAKIASRLLSWLGLFVAGGFAAWVAIKTHFSVTLK